MESHILNTYHQARYRTIGHKILRTSESLSPEGDCKQNSPEYKQARAEYGRRSWKLGREWSRNQNVNITRSQDTDSDEENIEVQDVSFDEPAVTELQLEPDKVEESLVEGDDYDVIQVFAVDPNLDLEASDDEEKEDYCIRSVNKQNADEYLSIEGNPNKEDHEVLTPEVLKMLDAPVVSNVDEYFIKEDIEKDILAVRDEPVVKDVDEYFIKEKPIVHNDNNFYMIGKQQHASEKPHRIQSSAVNVDDFFIVKAIEAPLKAEHQNDEVIKETDLEVLPKIEELKRYLLEDMTYSNFKKAQRSCSLPQSPIHNICLDLDDAKTCLSFEDLNLDLSDLTFDNNKDKSGNSAKSDENLRTLTEEDVNSFLITNKSENKEVSFDDMSQLDMEIENPVESVVETKPVIKQSIEPAIIVNSVCPPIDIPAKTVTSELIPKSNVLDFCIEKTSIKKEPAQVKLEESEDFVDIESCNDTIIPVLEANNLNSLLEQFEATEKLNKAKRSVIKIEDPKLKTVGLTNGMRLQDAGVQLSKNKMRQILMPSTINSAVRRSPSPVHSDHDYCSSKKLFSLPNIKGGQSLLKPEVLSSNSRILNSRHRSCKNKKVIYNLSSDDESEKCKGNNKKPDNHVEDFSEKTKKPSVKQTVKIITNPTRKKLSPTHSVIDTYKDKSNNSVIIKDACKASDSPISQISNGSIKLTIKNKSEVILNCDDKDSQKVKNIEKCRSSSVSEKSVKVEVKENMNKNNMKNQKTIKQGYSEKNKNDSIEKCTSVIVKEEPRSKNEIFYTTLFTNKQDVQIPQAMQIKTEKRSFEEELSLVVNKVEVEQPQKKKKLNLQEYKLRRGVSSNASSTAVSPEAIFPDMPALLNLGKTTKVNPRPQFNGLINVQQSDKVEQSKQEAPKKLFDPIREASRKILMNTKKQKAEAMRKRDEDIVMSKIPKVENLELQPLISDAEMLKIVGIAPAEALPVPIEKPQLSAEYQEIVMVSVGINTDDKVFKEMEKAAISSERAQKLKSSEDPKSHINFKIKKSDHILKQNVFDSMKRDKKSPVEEKKHSESKIDKKRYKEITAAMKSVEMQVDTKISSNSLFASIQDVVLKKAPDEDNISSKSPEKTSKHHDKYKLSNRQSFRPVKTTIVREYDTKSEHGEDKVILHLEKNRTKPEVTHVDVQTEPDSAFNKPKASKPEMLKEKSPIVRKRNDSDMSMSSDDTSIKFNDSIKRKERKDATRSPSKGKRSRSKDRYEKYRRSRTTSRNRRRRRSHSTNRSRSRGRFSRYRRSKSPYRRKRRSRSYRRRSPSIRREYRSNRSRSRNRETTRSKSPLVKKVRTPPHNADRKSVQSFTPSPRKPTISESSSSVSSSSSSSRSSSSSSEAGGSRRSSSRRRDEFRKTYRSPYSSEDRESNTPVEERRIVFVGKLEKDITKSGLRAQFTRFGPVLEVRLHSKEDGSRYGFVTFERARDAWTAVESAKTFPQYDVGFGGRRAFCRQSYADLDGLEAKYTESAFHGQPALSARRDDDMSFEQMLLEMKKKLSQRKTEKTQDDKA